MGWLVLLELVVVFVMGILLSSGGFLGSRVRMEPVLKVDFLAMKSEISFYQQCKESLRTQELTVFG